MITEDNKTQTNIQIVNRKYSLIQSAKQNLKDTDQTILILNLCNNMNTFGVGFNKIIAQEFPIAKENYHMLGATQIRSKLGYTQFIPVAINPQHKNQIIIANMICQTGIVSKSNTRPLNYYYLCMCLGKVKDYIQSYQHKNDINITVYSPKIENRITGANANCIYDIISDAIHKPTNIIVYDQYI